MQHMGNDCEKGRCYTAENTAAFIYSCRSVYHKNNTCHVIRVQSHGCPITGIQFHFFVIEYPHDLQTNYAWLPSHVSDSFQHL